MTNKQIAVLDKIVEIAQAVTGIAFAGLYPDSVNNVGQNFPAVIVRDGNEDASRYAAGREVYYTYTPEVMLITEVNTFNTRIGDILALQNALVTAIITDLSLSGLVHNIQGHRVTKGTDQDILATATSGYQGELSVHTIQFDLLIKDTRS